MRGWCLQGGVSGRQTHLDCRAAESRGWRGRWLISGTGPPCGVLRKEDLQASHRSQHMRFLEHSLASAHTCSPAGLIPSPPPPPAPPLLLQLLHSPTPTDGTSAAPRKGDSRQTVLGSSPTVFIQLRDLTESTRPELGRPVYRVRPRARGLRAVERIHGTRPASRRLHRCCLPVFPPLCLHG